MRGGKWEKGGRRWEEERWEVGDGRQEVGDGRWEEVERGRRCGESNLSGVRNGGCERLELGDAVNDGASRVRFDAAVVADDLE